MKRLLVSVNAKYLHKAPAVWMLQEACVRGGFSIDVYECDTAKPASAILRDMLRCKPGLIGFSCSIWNIALVERLTAALRRALPAAYIVWGGPEVSFDAENRVAALGMNAPDLILCGEGEEAFPALLMRLEKGERPSGVMRAAPVVPDRWIHLYPRGASAEPYRLHYAETSRGCPYACSYCLSGAEDGGVRALDADMAAARLLSTRDAGAETIKLLDRTFNFDPKRARHIWQTLIERGNGAAYHFEIAAHLLTDDDLSLLSHAPRGLFQFEIGVQSTNPETLRRIGRKQDFHHLAYAVKRLREMDTIHLHLDLIAGLPAETYASFAQAVDDVLSLKPHMLQLGFLKLLPGTPIRAEYDSLGYPYDPSPPYEVIATDTMSVDDLLLLHDIETTLSYIVHSGRMPRAACCFDTFASLETAALALRKEGFFDRYRGPEACFDALWRMRPHLAEDLKEDWRDLRKQIPRPWMR